MSQNKIMCTADVLKVSHFRCPQSERKMFSEANFSLEGFPPSATNGFLICMAYIIFIFFLKIQLRSVHFYSVTRHVLLSPCINIHIFE